jgi:uncharacterized repeat protein (TIGR03803 family)
MKQPKPHFNTIMLLAAATFLWVTAGTAFAAAPKYQVIYSMHGGKDGTLPNSAVTFDQADNVYGTTREGGDLTCPNDNSGCGIVFQLKPPQKEGGAWVKTTLYAFKGNSDGWYPSSVVADKAGNLYGATSDGIPECQDYSLCGTIFELKPPAKEGGAWVKSVLYSFKNFDDGGYPLGSLTFDASDNLYGTGCIGGSAGYGTVFELSKPTEPDQSWNKTELFSFDWTDGHCPSAGVIFDKSGKLYGATTGGGEMDQGLVFQLTPPIKKNDPWKESIFVYFDGTNGRWPSDRLTFDAKGNLYGTTPTGGSGGCASGVVFQLKPPTWKETQLHVFCDLGAPKGVVIDSSGILYGATADGGAPERGTVFELKPPSGKQEKWSESNLHTFTDGSGGNIPDSAVFGRDGALYGTTLSGGSRNCHGGCGVIYRIAP